MVFEDVVGQSHVTTTLRNAIVSNRLSHAYIFSGPRGVGKTTVARILAKAINCLSPKDFNPDNECDLCKEIIEGRSMNVFEIDGASNRGIDEIRNLRDAVRYAPARGKYKVYIVDEVHMLTKEAFNALLKTLEEPPPQVLFIFATTEIHKVPLTILSRCQRFEFRRIIIEEIVERLKLIAEKENITISDDAHFLIAKKADGSLRDAQSIFDQVISFSGPKIDVQQVMQILNIVNQEFFFRITDIIKSKDVKSVFTLVEEIACRGYDFREFLSGLNEHFRNLLIVRSTSESNFIEASETDKKRYEEEAKNFSEGDLLRLIKITSETETALRWSQSAAGGRFKLEYGLVQMVKMDNSIQIEQLLQQFDELKKKLDGTKSITTATSPIKTVFGEKSTTTTEPKNFTVTPNIVSEQPSVYQLKQSPLSPQKTKILQLTFEEAVGKWTDMIDEARKQRISIGTMLSQTTIIRVDENRLQIGCPDNFHLEELKKNREFLSALAEKVYGAKVHLEAIVAKTEHLQESSQYLENTPQQQIEKAGDLYKHPVVQALIREFDAKLI